MINLRYVALVLDYLSIGHSPRTAIRAVFSWSYRFLSDEERRCFRILGINPGRDVDLPAAAALLGTSDKVAGDWIFALSRAHLLREAVPGRFGMHDLLRVFARETSISEDSPDEHEAALERIADHYLNEATVATLILYPDGEYARLHKPDNHKAAELSLPIDNAQGAMARLNADRANIVAIVGSADFHSSIVVEFSKVLEEYLRGQGHLEDACGVHSRALDVTINECAKGDEAIVLYNLGNAFYGMGKYRDAEKVLIRSIDISQSCGKKKIEALARNTLGPTYDLLGEYDLALDQYSQVARLGLSLDDKDIEAKALINKGVTHWRAGQNRDALEALTSSLTISRAAGNKALESAALGNIGISYWRSGHYRDAIDYVKRALAIVREVGDRRREALTLDNLGAIYERTGSYDEALSCHREALAINREIGSRAQEGAVTDNLGIVYERLGQLSTSLRHHNDALRISRKTGERGLECETLTHLGRVSRRLGALDESFRQLSKSLEISRELRKQGMEAVALNELGKTYLAMEEPVKALACHQEAHELSKDIGDLYEGARAYEGIGDVSAASDVSMARKHWTKALRTYSELDVPEASDLRKRLS